MNLDRRQFIALAASGLLMPNRLLANTGDERKFVFVFCPGGWDQCYLSAPLFGMSNIDMEADAELGQLGGITFVDSPSRPSVRSFFQQYGHLTALINGFEARSIAHDICLRLVCTGSSLPGHDDWPSIIAAHSNSNPIMPMVHVSGPAYSQDYGSSIVRVGSGGQLSKLLQGTALNQSDIPVSLPQEQLDLQEDLWASDIALVRKEAAYRGRARQILDNNATAQDRLLRLRELRNQLELSNTAQLSGAFGLAKDVLRLGASRTIMLGFEGGMSLGWDTHAANFLQGEHLETLFSSLKSFVQSLHNTNGQNGRPLIETTTVVVLSEMGRFPQLNSRGGKDHWTYTSALMLGSGIEGGQTIGSFDTNCFGRKIQLSTGEVSETGVSMTPAHIGSTLLQLADIDPGRYIDNAGAIGAVIR